MERPSAPHGPEAVASRLAASRLAAWHRLLPEFHATHTQPLNVGLHLITTPMGLLGALGLTQALLGVQTMLTIAAAYTLITAVFVPLRTTLLTTLSMAVLVAAAFVWQPGWIAALVVLVIGWVAQELAHVFTGEQTLQSTYMNQQRWWVSLSEHTFFLLPLVLVAGIRCGRSLLGIFVPRSAVFKSSLEGPAWEEHLSRMRDFVARTDLDETITMHCWQKDLEPAERESFETLASAAPIIDQIRAFHGEGCQVDLLRDMNEVYVAAPPQKLSSDTVFYTPHIDGPWTIFPFAAVYRCILAVNENKHVHTHFPLNGPSLAVPESHTLTTGDAVAFDYNREPHYITNDYAENKNRRISLKLHYVVYPKSLGPWGRWLGTLSTAYNTRARQLFLDTIAPDSLFDKAKAAGVVATTFLFESIARFCGWAELLYVALLALISFVMGDLRMLLAGTSFIHYLLYIGALADPQNVSFGKFKRNAVFFKTLALAQLAGWWLYLGGYQSPLSIVCITAGYGLATWASVVLGLNRTYYGEELGKCEPKRIHQAPYGVIPHPMILGAAVGLSGFHLASPFRESIPWVIPIHLAFYAIVIVQEMLVYRARSYGHSDSGLTTH